MRYKIPILLMILAALSVSMFSGCELMPVEEALPTMPTVKEYIAETVKEAVVMRGDLEDSRTISLKLNALVTEDYMFGADMKGQKLGTCHVVKGQSVKKGDLLLELDNTNLYNQIATQEEKINDQKLKVSHLKENNDLELRLQNAVLAQREQELAVIQAQIKSLTEWEAQGNPDLPRPTETSMKDLLAQETAQKQVVERQKKTVESTQTNNQRKLDNAQTTMDVLQTRMNELYASIESRKMYAKFDGVVTFVDNFELHSKVEERANLTITNMDTMLFTLSGTDTQYFPIGTEVEIEMKDTLTKYKATAIDPATLTIENWKPEAGTVYFRAAETLPQLKNGAEASIKLVLDSRENVLYLISTAVKKAESSFYVSVLGEDGLKTNKEVTVGLRCNGYVEILSGLEEGDTVLAE